MNKTKYFLVSMLVLGIFLLVCAFTASAKVHVDDIRETIFIYDEEMNMDEVWAYANVTTAIMQNKTGGVFMTNYSIIINDTGALVLNPTEFCNWLQLNDIEGNAHINVTGKLYANDTMITGWNATEDGNSTNWTYYRPYIYIAPETDAQDTHAEFNNCSLGYLGYNKDNKYGIVYEDVENLDPTGHVRDCNITYNHIGMTFQGCDSMWINNTDFYENYYVGMVWTVSQTSANGADKGGAVNVNINNTGGATSADGMRTLDSDSLQFDYITINTVTNGGDGWHMDTAGSSFTCNDFNISNCAGWGMYVNNPGAGFTQGIYKRFTIDNCDEGGLLFETCNNNAFTDFNITASPIGFNFTDCHNDTFTNCDMEYTTDATTSYGYRFYYVKDTSISNSNISSFNYSIYIDELASDDSHNIDIDNTTMHNIGQEGAMLTGDSHHINFYDMTVANEDPDCGVWADAFYFYICHNSSIYRATISNVGGGIDVSAGSADIYATDVDMRDLTYAGYLIDGDDVTFDNCVIVSSHSWGVYINSNNNDLTFDACYFDTGSPAVYSMGNNSQGVWNNSWLSSNGDHVVEAEENATLYFYNCSGFWDDGGDATEYGFHLENATDVTITGFYGMDVETNITTSGYNYHKAQGNYVNGLFVNINMFNMTITPSTSYVLATVNTYTVSSVTWTLNAIGNVDVAHTFNDLTASTNYYPFKDALRYGTHVTTSGTGTTSWSYTDAWSEHDFALQTYSSASSATTANLLDNVIPVLVAVACLLMIIGLLFTTGVSIESLFAVLIIIILMIVTLQVVFSV